MHLYGLIIGISLIVGIEYFAKHQKIIPSSRFNFFILGSIISAIIGARAYHVADQWPFYSQHLSLIPQTWNGGLGIFGGIIGALIFIYLFCKISHYPFFSLLNSITPILPLCQTIGRFGNFVNHEIPTWWLEASLNLILFFLLKKSKNPTAYYLIGYGLIRFFVEFLRNDTWTINHLKIAQLISILFIVLGVTLINRQKLP
jgi:phosphatidylglycerol---prolipoprotein diacylglyceryl transferase